MSFQSGGVIGQLEAWLARAGSTLGGHTGDVFYANVHAWLSSMGLARLMLPASLLILGALALWTLLWLMQLAFLVRVCGRERGAPGAAAAAWPA